MGRVERPARPPPGADPSDLSRVAARVAARVRVAAYDAHELHQDELRSDALAPWLERGGVRWFDVATPSASDLQSLQRHFGLHPLLVSDLAHSGQRPYYADWRHGASLLLAEPRDHHRPSQVALVFGQDWVLSVREGVDDPFGRVRQRLAEKVGRLREMDASFLVATLAAALVDSFFEPTVNLREEIEELGSMVLEDEEPSTAAMQPLRREQLRLRHAIEPMHEALAQAARSDVTNWSDPAKELLRDATKDARHLLEVLEDADRSAVALADLNLALLQSRSNGGISALTVISTLFLPMTFLTGVWGMNFQNMPELHWRWGYVAGLTAIALSGLLTTLLIRHAFWFREMVKSIRPLKEEPAEKD